jgi:hypothetical protein
MGTYKDRLIHLRAVDNSRSNYYQINPFNLIIDVANLLH